MSTNNKDLLHTARPSINEIGGSRMRSISKAELSEIQNLHGQSFNKTLVEN